MNTEQSTIEDVFAELIATLDRMNETIQTINSDLRAINAITDELTDSEVTA